MNIIDTNNFSSIEYKPGEIYRYKATEIFDLLTEDLDYMYLSIDSKCSNCLVSITDFKYVYLNLYQFKYPNRWGESWDDIEPTATIIYLLIREPVVVSVIMIIIFQRINIQSMKY